MLYNNLKYNNFFNDNIKKLYKLKFFDENSVVKTHKNNFITIDIYIWCLYQTIDQLNYYNSDIFPSITSMLSNLIDNKNVHSITLIYDVCNNIFIQQNQSVNFIYFYNHKNYIYEYTQQFKKFVSNIIYKLNYNKVFTISLIVKDINSCHLIIIIFYRISLHNKIFYYLYDSQGYNTNTAIKYHSLLFLKHIKNIYPTIFDIKENYYIPNPHGLQKVSNDTFGWCSAFSFFWLFCLLSLYNHFEEILHTNIYDVENIILHNCKNNSLKLFKNIKQFMLYICNQYITNLKNLEHLNIFQNFLSYRIKSTIKNYKFYKINRIYNNSKKNNQTNNTKKRKINTKKIYSMKKYKSHIYK